MERNRNRIFLLLTDFFENDQIFIILEFEFGGADLENSNGTVSKAMSEFSVRVRLSIKSSYCFGSNFGSLVW